jgi:O-acetyl-ADP-ribose deacetylase (regulator of RNase III)
MKVKLFDINGDLCIKLGIAFQDIKEVEVTNSALDKMLEVDCLVTAGNSFGAMSGGIDLAFREIYGYQLQDIIQLGIMQHAPYGLPVGDTLMVKGQDCPDIIYAPTMRIPTKARPLDIAFVMSAIIVSANEYKYNSIAIPGLGTGAGELTPEVAADMMLCGYKTAVKLIEKGVKSDGGIDPMLLR